MTVGRRKLLFIGTGAVCAHALGCGGQDFLVAVPATVPAGNVSDLAVGTVRPIAGDAVAICRDTAGIYAMAVICTHQGCDMSVNGTITNTRLTCGCHASVFDARGDVVQGPARNPLQHFVVSKDGQGNLTIHGDQSTSASTRLQG